MRSFTEEMTSIFSCAPKITLIGLPPLFWASSITWMQAPQGRVGVAVSFLSLGVEGSKGCSLFKGPVWNFFTLSYKNYVGSGNLFGMEPPIAT
ncbi:MAG: hypothetical protein II157_02425, partial [Bacteroidales bacterium]|nr:hypothetical protein [Bacteroidales bacterium]